MGRLIWMNKPYKAGKNDLQIFTCGGLKEILLLLKKKEIGDEGYHGHQDAISSPNSHNSRPVKLSKSGALKRLGGFNVMTKKKSNSSRTIPTWDTQSWKSFRSGCCHFSI